MRIDLACGACGGNRFALGDAQSDEAVVRCEDCSETLGTLAALKERVAALVLGEEDNVVKK